MLLGTGNFADAQGQAGFAPLVLDQCHTLGVAAIIRTLEMAAPRKPFPTILQGVDEPFMKFAARLTASVERQVPDAITREIVIRTMLKVNSNDACKRVIAALSADPTVPEMVEACSGLDLLGQKMAGMATAVQPVWTVPQAKRPQQGYARTGKKRGKKAQKAKYPMFLCGRCGRPNHMSNACKATAHVTGQALPGSGNGKRSAQGRCAPTQASLQTSEPMEVCFAGLPPAPVDQQVWMSAPQEQLF
ncbi:endogenous retrovirus group K member 5 Gag polyprotein-like [Motacilla alba alba]|uniref:endogenous retrovirus group K member 5 Gag polyprotein-like n=1 Tax=Motacilla alba alba TaxID=1094192 RepID=UPI0018D544C5|nr:endogenous retrovirus group K member 5 Gag polyprotein-like [Motacilla alba alba]